jgi:hypothetical protein
MSHVNFEEKRLQRIINTGGGSRGSNYKRNNRRGYKIAIVVVAEILLQKISASSLKLWSN